MQKISTWLNLSFEKSLCEPSICGINVSKNYLNSSNDLANIENIYIN